ncbi:MAG: hypothetical protein NTZ35_00795, partial [Ignavibacteriales bacterium]|nr:hypothetical protein [Ignavibacteriales bacterium]
MELVSHWAKYLCVTCAGFLENALREIYGEYARNSADTSVARYVYKQLDRIQNPNTQKFLDIAYQFDDNWGRDLEAFVADESRKSAIDTIMANRNLIA